jgi:hypothetical protein
MLMPESPKSSCRELDGSGRSGRLTGTSRSGVQYITRRQNRFASMRDSEAAKITDAFEVRVEEQYREYLLAIPQGTLVLDGWKGICDWITENFGVPYGDGASLHSHLTVLLMTVVGKLCKTGFLAPTNSEAPEDKFVRTSKPAPIGDPWD